MRDEEQVEAAHDGHGHVHVRLEGFGAVVAAVLRVRSRRDRGARVQVRLDAGLGDGDRLLLHGLVDRDLVRACVEESRSRFWSFLPGIGPEFMSRRPL